MKVKINNLQIWINAEDAQVGTVYSCAIGGDALLRINLCALHEDASPINKIAFLRLNEDDICTVLYPPNQRMIFIGEPTVTINPTN